MESNRKSSSSLAIIGFLAYIVFVLLVFAYIMEPQLCEETCKLSDIAKLHFRTPSSIRSQALFRSLQPPGEQKIEYYPCSYEHAVEYRNAAVLFDNACDDLPFMTTLCETLEGSNSCAMTK